MKKVGTIIKVAISGGFDPIHIGHIEYLEAALGLGSTLIIILSRDAQLTQKKGVCAVPYKVRKAVLEWGLKGRGMVVENLDDSLTSCKSLRYYKPDIFAKGGDTWDKGNLPEREVCKELGIKMLFGVGGYNKPYSSSDFLVKEEERSINDILKGRR